jgi:glycolate oxidase FAD binding subunit
MMRAIKTYLDVRYFYDWAGGLIWLDCLVADDCGEPYVRSHVDLGHSMLARAPESMRADLGALQPQAPPLAALAARVKDAFDPDHVLNPGKMVWGH